jgi:hypothetical protein
VTGKECDGFYQGVGKTLVRGVLAKSLS